MVSRAQAHVMEIAQAIAMMDARLHVLVHVCIINGKKTGWGMPIQFGIPSFNNFR